MPLPGDEVAALFVIGCVSIWADKVIVYVVKVRRARRVKQIQKVKEEAFIKGVEEANRVLRRRQAVVPPHRVHPRSGGHSSV